MGGEGNEQKMKGVGYKDWEKDESSEKKNLSLEEEGNMKKVWEGQREGKRIMRTERRQWDNEDREKEKG